MKIDAFLTCLGYYGITTGAATALEGAYSLTSGNTGVFFNQLYSSGAHYVNGRIYGPTLPLINIYGNKIINNTIVSGNQGLRVGYAHTGNFSLVMDIEYSGCTRPADQRSMILMSTASTPSGLNSGFLVGITESNRLYFNTSGYSATLGKELSNHDFVYVSLAERKYVTMGIYSLNDNKLYKQNITLPSGTLNSNDLYIGNLLRYNPTDPYTGFSGKLNQLVLFNDKLTDEDVGICSNCALTTGFNTGTNAFSFVAQQMTGMMFSGVFDYAVTGYTNVTGNVTSYDSSIVQVVFPSGLTGYIQTGVVAIPLFSGINVQGLRDDYVFLYDTNALNSFSTFSLFFDVMLSSGDTIEIYSYPQPNPNIGKRPNGILWPTDTGVIQLIANGLNETSGIDYYIVRNEISGYFLDDVLSYDVLQGSPIVTAYSGYWNDTSKLQMSGGGFYPSAPQYFENANFTGIVKITGLSGICTSNPFYPRFGYDLHMNGQKLLSGMHYDVVTSGTSGFVVSLSGKMLPQLIVYGNYDPTGGGPISVSSVDDSELAFIPQFSGFRRTRLDVNSDGFGYGVFTGFGEQVWINGIRQLKDLDYIKTQQCNSITGTYNPPNLDFLMYDSDLTNNLWNVPIPQITGISISIVPATADIALNLNGWPSTSEPCIEFYQANLVDDGVTFGGWVYVGKQASPIYLIQSGFAISPGFITTSGLVLARYHHNNKASE
jgi:hypothetical protein